MAMRKCPDCRQEMSTEAGECPSCGRPAGAFDTPGRTIKALGAVLILVAIPVGLDGSGMVGPMVLTGLGLMLIGRLAG